MSESPSIPEKRPRTSTFVGRLAWSYSPGSSRVDDLYLSQDTSRRYWLLWRVWNDPDFSETNVAARLRRSGQSPREAAAHLVRVAYRDELDEFGNPPCRYVVWDEGVLSEKELLAIADLVWEPNGDTAADDEEEDEDEAEDTGDGSSLQVAVDALIGAWTLGVDYRPLVTDVTGVLEARGAPHVDGEPVASAAIAPDVLQAAFAGMDDDDVREGLELGPRIRITDVHRLQYFEEAVLPAVAEDADVASAFMAVTIKSSNGATAILVAAVQGYSFSSVEHEWIGVFTDEDDFRDDRRGEGWVLDVGEFAALPMRERLRMVRGEASLAG
jgi:hypothetical protein